MPTILNSKKNELTEKEKDSGGLFSKVTETAKNVGNLFPSSDSEEKKKFREEDPKWSFDEVVLRKEIRETLEDVVTFCQNKDKLIEEWDLNRFLKGNSSIGINFYGEPGTGKTISAEAIAKALNRKIIKADYSEIQDSKWGATEKNLTELFKKAEETGSIILLDEADGLLGKRMDSGPNASTANEIKSHLLTLVDKSNVIIFYTTNLFKNFDRAFFRRIVYHINIPMPNKEELISIWKYHLEGKPEKPPLKQLPIDSTSFSYEDIADSCVGELAGGDVKNLTLKLCVKLAAKKISALTTENVKAEIERYKKSLADSRGLANERVVPASELTEEEKEELKNSKPTNV
jgi:SpoVK/Ycf46/Vps4 family AAA+-type ATPase